MIESVCECQAKLEAEVDEHGHVLRGWARDRRTKRILVAPAHSIGAGAAKFQVAWMCPLCTRNQLRSFDSGALELRDPGPRAA